MICNVQCLFLLCLQNQILENVLTDFQEDYVVDIDPEKQEG